MHGDVLIQAADQFCHGDVLIQVVDQYCHGDVRRPTHTSGRSVLSW